MVISSSTTTPHRTPGDLSRDYRIPKNPTFVLGAAHPPTARQERASDKEGVPTFALPQCRPWAEDCDVPPDDDDGWCIVQNPNNTTFDVSPMVLDNIMASTNGLLGVKHRSETQTAVCRSYVKMNRVYHKVPLTQELRSVALPTSDEVGAVLCVVDVNVCVNGEACNLSEMYHRSLSMRDGVYRSRCLITTSGGELSFMMEYRRFVSLKRLTDWCAAVKYSDFVFSEDLPAGFRLNLTALAEIRVLKDHWNIQEGASPSSFSVMSHSSGVEVASQSWAECAVWSRAPVSVGTSPVDESVANGTGIKTIIPPAVGGDAYRRSDKGPQEHFHGADHNLTVFSSSDCDSGTPADDASTGGSPTAHYWIALRRFDVDIVKGLEPISVEMTLLCSHLRSDDEHTRGGLAASVRSSPSYASSSDASIGGSAAMPPEKVMDLNAHRKLLLAEQREMLNEFWDSFEMKVDEDDGVVCPGDSAASDRTPVSQTTTTDVGVVGGVFLGTLESSPTSQAPLSPFPPGKAMSSGRLTASLQYGAFTAFCTGAGAHYGVAANALSSPGISMQLNLQHYLYHGLFYIFAAPRAAQRLMRHLIDMLPHARAHARRLSLTKGALFPHSTISGEECGSYFLTKSPRFHINADLSYIIFLYLEGAGEIVQPQERLDLLELILEMGRVWLEVGEWQEHHTAFRIDEVSGPDEYAGLVDGNFYTLLSVKRQLNQTTQWVRRLLRNSGATVKDFACVGTPSPNTEESTTALPPTSACPHCNPGGTTSSRGGFGGGHGNTTLRSGMENPTPQQVRSILESIGMADDELAEMQRAADAIVLPRDDRTGVFFAHEHFDALKSWSGGEPNYPLYLNYHPLVVYRHKLCEIPEVLLGMLIYPICFEQSDIQRNLVYYEPLCTHDTPESLAVVAATRFRAFGDVGKGLPPLKAVAQLDLDNITYTAEEGIHLSAMTSSWMAVVFGIGGLRVVDGSLHMNPALPVGVDQASFTIQWRGAAVKVSITSDNVVYELFRGASFRLIHHDHTRVHLHQARANVFAAQRKVAIPRTLTQQMTAHFDGVVFTIESLVENLLDINFEAWSRVLNDGFLREESEMRGVRIEPFTIAEYIQRMVYQEETGSANFSGLQNVLASRGITLELGSASDMELVVTRYGLANAKVEELREILRQGELQLVPGALDLLMDMKALGLRVALVSYTRSMYDALQQLPHAISELFTTMIDGTEAREKALRGRPHTDLFLRAARKMHVPPSRCIVCATHLDRGYREADLKEFLMFVDVEEPRTAELRRQGRQGATAAASPPDGQVSSDAPLGGNYAGVLRIGRGQMPRSTAELEDAILAASTRRGSSAAQ